MSTNGKFVTSISCMDGRIQEPIINWMKTNYAAQFVDSITEPGPDCIVCSQDKSVLEGIKAKVMISVEKHGSHAIALSGHVDCAGNPCSKEEHIEEIKLGVNVIKSWNLTADVIGLWVNENWQVEQVI